MSAIQSAYDYKKYAVLYVDDEEKSLKYFARAFDDQFRILTASNARDGLALLEQHKDDIGLLMTDQRMPSEKGVWLLEQSRLIQPRIIRMLATAYADMEAAIAAVNTGAIYKYITKPWDPPQLETTLKRGLEFFMVQQERDQLLREKLSVLRNMMIGDRIVSLGLLAAGMSHHIRNSLVAVKTFLDLAPRKLEEENLDLNGLRNPDFWKVYYQNVQSQIERINGLLKDLWTASEKPGYAFNDSVQLQEVLEAAQQKMAASLEQKKIRIHLKLAADLPLLIVDRSMFQRLFELLFKDEIVSLPAGSEITVSARKVTEKRIPGIEVKVCDNGPGLPKEALRVIFDPFAVRSDNPLEYGINLMGCFFVVHHHGGRIEAESNGGNGTVFTLFFPLDPNQVAASEGNTEFLRKAILDETLWERLLATA